MTTPNEKPLDAATCSASSFSPEQIEQWLAHMESIASASPQMAAVIRLVKKDVQHPHDGIAAFLQQNAGGMARELAAQDSESPTKQNG